VFVNHQLSMILKDDWKRVMNMFNLQENEWRQRLFEIRELWIFIFNRNTFFAGSNTTQRILHLLAT
jgi:hypothetical protein